MSKFFLLLFFLLNIILPLSGADYSQVSTQELLAAMGYSTNEKNKKNIEKELEKRVLTMDEEQLREYTNNLKQLQNQGQSQSQESNQNQEQSQNQELNQGQTNNNEFKK